MFESIGFIFIFTEESSNNFVNSLIVNAFCPCEACWKWFKYVSNDRMSFVRFETLRKRKINGFVFGFLNQKQNERTRRFCKSIRSIPILKAMRSNLDQKDKKVFLIIAKRKQTNKSNWKKKTFDIVTRCRNENINSWKLMCVRPWRCRCHRWINASLFDDKAIVDFFIVCIVVMLIDWNDRWIYKLIERFRMFVLSVKLIQRKCLEFIDRIYLKRKNNENFLRHGRCYERIWTRTNGIKRRRRIVQLWHLTERRAKHI